MTAKENKVIWKLARNVYLGGFLLWITETIIFLIIDGWHLKATNKHEIFLDDIVAEIWSFSLVLTFICCFNYLLNLTFNNNKL
jgi:hypothetical protein